MKDLFKKNKEKITKKLEEDCTDFFAGKSSVQKTKKIDFPDNIKDLLPYRYYDEALDLYFNEIKSDKDSGQSCGFILEASPMVGVGESDIDILSNFFNDNLPEGLILQILNYASPRIGHLLDKWENERDKEGGVYKELAKKRVDFINSGRWKSLFPDPYVARDFRVLISASLPRKRYEDAPERLRTLREKFISNLNNLKITTENIRPSELLSFLDEVLNPDKTKTHHSEIKWEKLDPINIQASDSESIFEVKKDQINLSDNICARSLTVKNFPEVWKGWDMINLSGLEFRDSLRVSCPFLTNLTIEVPSENKTKSRAFLRQELLEQRSSSGSARFWPGVKNMASEWSYVKDHLEKGQRLVKAKYNVLLFCDKENIDREEERLKAIYTAKGFKIKTDTYLHLPSFLSALPFWVNEERFKNFKFTGKTKTLLSWSCANIAPLQGEMKGAVNSPYLMLLGKRGQPLFWNPYNSGEAGGNFNVAVTGKAGSGKSVFMQELVASIRGAGGRVFIIDDGESFKNSCHLQGGKFIEIGSNICINPFTMFDWDALRNDDDYRNDIQNFFVSLLIQICRPLTSINEDEKGLLESAVFT